MNSKILIACVVFTLIAVSGAKAVAPPPLPVEYVAPAELEQLKKMAEKAQELELRLKANEADITRLKTISAELDATTKKIKALQTEKDRLSRLAEEKHDELTGIDEQLAATRGKLENVIEQTRKDQENERIFMAFCILVIAAASFSLGAGLKRRR